MKHILPAIATALLLTLNTPGGEAVSNPNGKAEFFGGRVDGNSTYNLSGSYSFPLSTYFGAQIDGLYGQLDDRGVYATGGHLFWRNSDYALLGLSGSYLTHRDANLWRIGGEGEMYWHQITLAGQLGHQAGDLGDDGYGRFDARYYLAEDYLMLAGGAGHYDGRTIWNGEAEYLTDLGGLGLFASGGRGGDDYYYFLGGIRYYFGAKKSLMRRHREDDPLNPLFGFASEALAPLSSSSNRSRTPTPPTTRPPTTNPPPTTRPPR